MFVYLKGLLKESVIYSIGNILNKASGLILLPIYSQLISIEEFGILTILELIALALIQICNLGLTSGFQRYFFIEKEKGHLGSFLYSNIVSLIIMYIPFIIFGLYFNNELSHLFFDTIDYSFCFKLLTGIILIEMLFDFQQMYLQNEQKSITYTVFSVTNTIVTLGITIYLIKYNNWGIEAVFVSRLISKTLITLISFITYIYPILEYKLSIKSVKTSLIYGFPIVISSLGYIVYTMSDRFMLNELTDEASLGKYSIGVRVASVINIVFIKALGLGFLPQIFKNENNKRLYTKTFTYFTYGISAIILFFLMTYSLPIELLLKNKEYTEGLIIVPILSIYFLALGSNYFLYSGISTSNKSKYLIYPTLITALVNIVLNYILIPKFGYISAAVTTLLSQFLYIFIANKIVQKINPIKFEWKKIFFSVSIAIGLYAIFIYFNEHIFLAPILTMLYLIILYNFKFLEPHEKERIKLTISKQKQKYLNF